MLLIFHIFTYIFAGIGFIFLLVALFTQYTQKLNYQTSWFARFRQTFNAPKTYRNLKELAEAWSQSSSEMKRMRAFEMKTLLENETKNEVDILNILESYNDIKKLVEVLNTTRYASILTKFMKRLLIISNNSDKYEQDKPAWKRWNEIASLFMVIDDEKNKSLSSEQKANNVKNKVISLLNEKNKKNEEIKILKEEIKTLEKTPKAWETFFLQLVGIIQGGNHFANALPFERDVLLEEQKIREAYKNLQQKIEAWRLQDTKQPLYVAYQYNYHYFRALLLGDKKMEDPVTDKLSEVKLKESTQQMGERYDILLAYQKEYQKVLTYVFVEQPRNLIELGKSTELLLDLYAKGRISITFLEASNTCFSLAQKVLTSVTYHEESKKYDEKSPIYEEFVKEYTNLARTYQANPLYKTVCIDLLGRYVQKNTRDRFLRYLSKTVLAFDAEMRDWTEDKLSAQQVSKLYVYLFTVGFKMLDFTLHLRNPTTVQYQKVIKEMQRNAPAFADLAHKKFKGDTSEDSKFLIILRNEAIKHNIKSLPFFIRGEYIPDEFL